MTLPIELQKLFEDNGGILLTSVAEQAGITRKHMWQFAKAGLIERVAQGVYAPLDEIDDRMYILSLRVKKLCFSHETALYFYGLTDRTPFKYSVTVPSGYKPSDVIRRSCKVYYIKPELFDFAKTTAKTNMENSVPVYDVERTICDIVRSRNKIDPQIVTDALKRYVAQKNPDLNKLHNYAGKFGVTAILQKYMEVLL